MSKKIKYEKCNSCGAELVMNGICQACGINNAGTTRKKLASDTSKKDTTPE